MFLPPGPRHQSICHHSLAAEKRDNFIAGDQNALGYKALNGSSVSQRGDSTVDLAHHWSGGGDFRSVESIHQDAQQHTYSSKT